MEGTKCAPARIGVAIMGYGVVGKGVAHAIRNNRDQVYKKTGLDVRLLHVLDLLDFPDSPDAALITRDVADIMGDADVSVVVETMGGVGAALEFTKMALASGKHVVTSNKELVAEHGPELLALAQGHGAFYRFDASVGGGIPVINPIEECLSPNNIDEVLGIFNGTTNFMLTYMKARGAGFMETLARAQEHGYAESDPSSDIEGRDACRKLAIIASIAFGSFLDWKSVHTQGMSQVTLTDIARAADLGRTLKFIARVARREDGRCEAYVAPALVDRRSPLAHVDWVNNAVMIHGDLTGYIMLYGPGAGMYPTGNSIVSDIIKTVSGAPMKNPVWDRRAPLELVDFGEYIHEFYVRADAPDPEAYREAVFREFPDARVLPKMGGEGAGEFVFVTPGYAENEFTQKLARINARAVGASTGFYARLLPWRE